jgi:hypothetical protein
MPINSKLNIMNLEFKAVSLKFRRTFPSKNTGIKIAMTTSNIPAKLKTCMKAFGTKIATKHPGITVQRHDAPIEAFPCKILLKNVWKSSFKHRPTPKIDVAIAVTEIASSSVFTKPQWQATLRRFISSLTSIFLLTSAVNDSGNLALSRHITLHVQMIYTMAGIILPHRQAVFKSLISLLHILVSECNDP